MWTSAYSLKGQCLCRRWIRIFYSTIPNLLKKKNNMIICKILRVQQWRTQLCSVGSICSMAHGKISFDSRFYAKLVIHMSVFHVWGISNTQNTRNCGTETPKKFKLFALRSEKVPVWCTIRDNAASDPYDVINDTVRGDDYYRMLKTFVRSEAKTCHWLLASNETELLLVSHVICVLYWMSSLGISRLEDLIHNIDTEDNFT